MANTRDPKKLRQRKKRGQPGRNKQKGVLQPRTQTPQQVSQSMKAAVKRQGQDMNLPEFNATDTYGKNPQEMRQKKFGQTQERLAGRGQKNKRPRLQPQKTSNTTGQGGRSRGGGTQARGAAAAGTNQQAATPQPEDRASLNERMTEVLRERGDLPRDFEWGGQSGESAEETDPGVPEPPSVPGVDIPETERSRLMQAADESIRDITGRLEQSRENPLGPDATTQERFVRGSRDLGLRKDLKAITSAVDAATQRSRVDKMLPEEKKLKLRSREGLRRDFSSAHFEGQVKDRLNERKADRALTEERAKLQRTRQKEILETLGNLREIAAKQGAKGRRGRRERLASFTEEALKNPQMLQAIKAPEGYEGDWNEAGIARRAKYLRKQMFGNQGEGEGGGSKLDARNYIK